MSNLAAPRPHLNSNPYIKALLYGDPGSGKTSLAASAAKHPQMGKVLFLSVEGGLLAVPSNSNILVAEIRNEPGATALDQIEAYLFQLGDVGKPNDSWMTEVKTVVIDSGTELLTLELEAIVDEAVSRKPDRNRNAIYVEDYGTSTASMKRILRYMRDLPMNVIVTALAKPLFEGKKEDSVQIGIGPSFTEKLAKSVMGYMDHVWYTFTDDDENGKQRFNILTRNKNGFLGKTRGRSFGQTLGDHVVNPDLAKIYSTLLKCETSISLSADGSLRTKPTAPTTPVAPVQTVENKE